MPPPLGQRRHQLAGIALRVPLAGVGVGPLATGLGIEIVEDPLHRPHVHEQSFDLQALVRAARIGGLAVEEELFSPDGDFGAARRRGGAHGGYGARQCQESSAIHDG